MRLVSINELMVGDIPAQNIYNERGMLLLTQGIKLNEGKIKALKRIGLDGVYIEDEISAGIVTKAPISDKVLISMMRALHKVDIENIIETSKEMVKELSDNLYDNDMLMLKNYDDYTMQHSINVAIFATVLAKSIGMNDREAEQVAQAGLLHDIGKLLVPNRIITKPGRLTEDEYEEVKRHSEYGYKQLVNRTDIWAVVRVGVLEHHENEDGSGYPRGISSEKIHAIGKILHIADVYDALTTKRSYKDGWTPKKAMAYILDNKGRMFDEKFAELFYRCIPLYFKGTIVNLSNGEEAIIVKNNVRDSTRPLVRTTDGTEIDLFAEKNIYIVDEETQ